MSVLKDSLRGNTLGPIACALLLLILLVQTLSLFVAIKDQGAIKQDVSRLATTVGTMNGDINSMKNTLLGIGASLDSIEGANILAIDPIMLQGGDTWMVPCASASWSGR